MGNQVDIVHSPFHDPLTSVDGLTFHLGGEYNDKVVEIDFNPQVIAQGSKSVSGGVEMRGMGVYGASEAHARFDLQQNKTQKVTTKAGQYIVTLLSISELDGFKRFKFEVEKN